MVSDGAPCQCNIHDCKMHVITARRPTLAHTPACPRSSHLAIAAAASARTSRHLFVQVPKASTAYALVLIFTWYSMSTALSIYNKKVLGKHYGFLDGEPFPAPLFMTSVQFLTQFGMAWLALQCVAKRTLDPSTQPAPPASCSAHRCMLPHEGISTPHLLSETIYASAIQLSTYMRRNP